LHLRDIFRRHFLGEQRFQMRRAIRTLYLDKPIFPDKPVWARMRALDRRMRDKPDEIDRNVGPELISGTRIGLALCAPIHCLADVAIDRGAVQALKQHIGADIGALGDIAA
jgi:hypothetical protein